MKIEHDQVRYEVGDTIIDVKKSEYTVIDTLSGGAQNAGMYLVQKNNKKYVLKLLVNSIKGFNDSNVAMGNIKMRNVVNMLNETNRFARLQLSKEESCGCFMMPLVLYNPDVVGMDVKGYLMSYAKGNNIIKVLYEDTSSKMYMALMNLCAVFRRLQNYGFNFKDLSLDNVRYDPDSGKIFIIDCDNIQRNVTGMYRNQVDLMAKGTGWAIAPELVYGDAMQTGNTDSFSLAYLLFTILVSTERTQKINKVKGKEVLGKVKYFSIHPYFGETFRKSVSTGSLNLALYKSYAESEGIDDSSKYLVFIFDSKNSSNRLNTDIPRFKLFTERWNALPESVRDKFEQAFDDPFEEHRPTANKWENCFKNVLSSMGVSSPIKNEPLIVKESKQEFETVSKIVESKEWLIRCYVDDTTTPLIDKNKLEVPGSLVGVNFPIILDAEVSNNELVIHNSSFLTLKVNDNYLKKGARLTFDTSEEIVISSLLFKKEIHISVDE